MRLVFGERAGARRPREGCGAGRTSARSVCERCWEGIRQDWAVREASEACQSAWKAEPSRTGTAHAGARERLAGGCVVASCGGESRRRAGAQLSRGEALDDAQAAAATRADPTGSDRVLVGERNPARRVDASDQAAAERQQLAAFGVGQKTQERMRWKPLGSTCNKKRRKNSSSSSVSSRCRLPWAASRNGTSPGLVRTRPDVGSRSPPGGCSGSSTPAPSPLLRRAAALRPPTWCDIGSSQSLELTLSVERREAPMKNAARP